MRYATRFGIVILLVLVSVLPSYAQIATSVPTLTPIPPTATALPPTATATPTAISTVVLSLSASSLITSTMRISQQLIDFSGGADTSASLLVLAAIVIGFWSFMFVRELMT